MIKRNLLQKTNRAVFVALGLVLVGTTARAQQPTTAAPAAVASASEKDFSFELGRTMAERGAAGGSTYSVAATTAYGSKQKGAKLRLTVVEKDGGSTMTHLLTVNTGKHKTVSQLSEILVGVFRKYLSVEPFNQEIGKIGDINHGGEIRFFAESRESFRYDWLTPGEQPRSTKFKRNDIQVFLDILTHPKAGN